MKDKAKRLLVYSCKNETYNKYKLKFLIKNTIGL
jgi:hypothetical protein